MLGCGCSDFESYDDEGQPQEVQEEVLQEEPLQEEEILQEEEPQSENVIEPEVTQEEIEITSAETLQYFRQLQQRMIEMQNQISNLGQTMPVVQEGISRDQLQDTVDNLVLRINERVEELNLNDEKLLTLYENLNNELRNVMLSNNQEMSNLTALSERVMDELKLFARNLISETVRQEIDSDWQNDFRDWMDRYSAWVCQTTAGQNREPSEECREILQRRGEVLR